MNAEQLQKLVIQPTLKHIQLASPDAERLLLGTAAQESAMGKYLKQYPTGPALGIYQMEPKTLWYLYERVRDEKPALWDLIEQLATPGLDPEEQLPGNLYFATAMCRLHYLFVPKALPTTLAGYAGYWKKYYNTPLGHGTEQQFIDNYYVYVCNDPDHY